MRNMRGEGACLVAAVSFRQNNKTYSPKYPFYVFYAKYGRGRGPAASFYRQKHKTYSHEYAFCAFYAKYGGGQGTLLRRPTGKIT